MYARSYECPNCGGAVPFASSITVFAVCGYCRSMVVRRDAGLERLGEQAQLPPDLSPLRPGTQGELAGEGFTLAGRLRVGYAEGSWNEWCALFPGDRWGWVAESQGHYLVSFEVAATAELPGWDELQRLLERPGEAWQRAGEAMALGRDRLAPGAVVGFAGTTYVVRDLKETECLGSEGELPFVAVPGRTALSVDLGGEGGAFLNLEYSGDGLRVFQGRACRFADLHLRELRPLPGWTTDVAEVTRRASAALNCPACGAAVELRAPGLSMSVMCGSCGTLLDTTHPEVRRIAQVEERIRCRPALPIGRRGRFDGLEWEVIGFQRRRDNWGESWDEYLLFNPFHGFRWLVTYQGHWSLVDLLLEAPRTVDEQPVLDGQPYRLFAVARAEVTHVLGEFYWRVTREEAADLEDYIRPPFVLSRESYPGLSEVTWSHGRYLTPAEVQVAFGLETELREPAGVYLNQPNPHAEKGRTLRWLAPLAAGVFLVVGLWSAATRAREPVFSASFAHTFTGTSAAGAPSVPGATNRTVVSEPFRIGGSRPQVVQLELTSGVNQGWLGLDVDLVDIRTQRSWSAGLLSEHYSGVEGGEAWEEGRLRDSALIPSVPPGEYRLVMDPAGEAPMTEVAYGLSVTRDVPVWSNFWLGLAGLLAYPAYRLLREHAFERQRWSASDFSPYASAESDDDEE